MPGRASLRATRLALALAIAASVTHDEAMCIIRDQRIAFFGDSLSRYCFFGMNAWLKTGALRDEEFDDKWGDEGLDYDCCEDQQWTSDKQDCNAGSGHRMYLYADFEEVHARTSFYFIASTWFDDLADLAEDLRVDTVVYNMGRRQGRTRGMQRHFNTSDLETIPEMKASTL